MLLMSMMPVHLLPSICLVSFAAFATSLRVSALAGPDPIGVDLGDFSMDAGKQPTTGVVGNGKRTWALERIERSRGYLSREGDMAEDQGEEPRSTKDRGAPAPGEKSVGRGPPASIRSKKWGSEMDCRNNAY
jgi:hypothetical protein